jgi:neutral amino acid transport system permease protein
MANIPNFSKKFNVILKIDSNGATDVPDYTTEVGLNRLVKGIAKSLRVMTAGFLIMGGLLAAAPASAEELDPSTFAYSIAGTLQQDDVPITGVVLTASLDGESFSTESDEFGEWMIMVPTAGIWEVSLDVSTIPAEFNLVTADGAVGEADLTATDFAAVLFKFGTDDSNVRQSFSDQLTIRVFAGLNFGLMLALAAIGITLIYGTTGLNNFAHGEMVTLGALFMWLFYSFFQLNILVAGVLAILVVTLSGWAQDAGIWKPLRKRRMGLNQIMIVSIGLSLALQYSILLSFGGQTKDLNRGQTIFEFGPIVASNITLASMALSVATLLGVAVFLTRTRIGKATRAVSDNPSLASATGIDVEKVIRVVWLMAAALTGLAGVLYGLQFQANWSLGFDILLLLFAAVTLGGLGTSLGAAVGGLIIGMVVEVSTLFIPSELKYVTGLVILIVILIVRPQGVLGKKQRVG